MKLHLRVWRQKGREAEGQFETYEADGIKSEHVFFGDDGCGERSAGKRGEGAGGF